MSNVKQIQPPPFQADWSSLLASIPDIDLDLLISANTKMQRGETVLSRRELEACIRWQLQLDGRSITSAN